MDEPRIKKEELEKLISEMNKHYENPSQVVLEIKSFEDAHTKRMLKEFGRYVGYFENGYDLLLNIVFLVNYLNKKTWPTHRSIQLLLLKNNLGSLYSAFDRLMNSFYSDATILLRTVYETYIRILFISFFPNDQYVSLVSKPPKGKMKFNLTNFTKSHLKVDWDFIYSVQSSFSHSHKYQTLHELIQIHKQGQRDFICFELKFDEKNASIPMNLSLFLLWCLIKISALLFIDPKDKKVKQGFYSKLVATEKALGAIIMSMPNKFAKTFDDVERITEEIKTREKIQ